MADYIVAGFRDSTLTYIPHLKALPDEYVESTAAYKKAFPGVYSKETFYDRGLGRRRANAIRDAAVLHNALNKKGTTLANVAEIYKKFFKDLGYEFIKQDGKEATGSTHPSITLSFKGVEIDLIRAECPHSSSIYFDDRAGLEGFKSLVDFSTVKGVFAETSSGDKDGGNHIRNLNYDGICR